jgi:outer membrane protein TolC
VDAGENGSHITRDGSISLGDVTAAALANNPSIKEALRKWNAAKARIPQATAWDDLRVGGESRVHRFVDVPPNAFTDQSASIEQPIPITGKNLVRGRAATAEAVSAYEQLRRQQLDVIAAARAAFFRLANAHAQIEINQKNITSMRQIADISRTKFETGTHSAADVLVAETEASKLLESERDLERQLSEQEAPLLLAHRPEIKMAEAKIDLEKSNLQLAHRAWIPDPALTVKAERYNDTGQAVSELDAGVSFTVPWVNFRKYGAAVREGQENVGAAEQALERSENEALRLLRDQLQKVETAHHHLELFRDKIIPQAQQAYEANRLNYESGKASFLDWITSQRNLRDLEAMGRQHLADYQVAVVELEATVGAEFYPLPSEGPELGRRGITAPATTKGGTK